MSEALRVGVAGATGYAGRELVRLLARHPGAALRVATVSTPADESREVPSLRGVWKGGFRPLALDELSALSAVFLALPESVAAKVAPTLVDAGVRVFDLSGAFRLRDAEARKRWYPESPELSRDGVVYGLTEMHRDELPGAKLVTCPGCYPTAALLALGPLVAANLLAPGQGVIVDAKSGISGAGKAPSTRTHFSELHGNVAAYGIFGHRHVAEMEQDLGRSVTFVPHLVPLNRGILETIYAQLAGGVTDADVSGALQAAYADAPFVRLTGSTLPEIQDVAYTNFCDIGWKVDAATGRLVVVACLDNLLKGAAGQAVQNFNVAFGLDEREGLE
jgi:N-acetyl-gamma-glutamyl-phosphate reductase